LTDLFEPVIPGVANCAVLKGRWELSLISGGYGEGETPLPISNRAVKPLSADGTWPARARESRTPPVSSPERAARQGRLFCVVAPTCRACAWSRRFFAALRPRPRGRGVHSHRPACTAPSDGTASATKGATTGARLRTAAGSRASPRRHAARVSVCVPAHCRDATATQRGRGVPLSRPCASGPWAGGSGGAGRGGAVWRSARGAPA
jgi:hypothetical protein